MVISHITGNTVTFEGGSIVLICNVTNDVDSSLEITWQHNNRSIADHDRMTISNTTDGATGQVQSMLYIDPVNRTDKGEYKCSALNHLECVAEAITNLTVECKLFSLYPHSILTMCTCTYNRCTNSVD